MKKILVTGLCVAVFASIASAFIWFERPVNLNGKPFAKALTIDGVIAISVEDLAMNPTANSYAILVGL